MVNIFCKYKKKHNDTQLIDWKKGGHGHSGGNHSHVAFFKLGDGGEGGGMSTDCKSNKLH